MKNKPLKYLFIVLGIVSVALGVIGIIIPLLPTTPFLLLASFLFFKSSDKLHGWLLGNKVLGDYIYNYITYKTVKKRVKVAAIIVLWVTLLISIYLMKNLYVHIALVAVGLAVTTHLLLLKSTKKSQTENIEEDNNE